MKNKISLFKQLCYRNAHNWPSRMKCIQLQNYAENVSDLKVVHTTTTPKVIGPHQALVKVHAASINPFDIENTAGYGRTVRNFLQKGAAEFPLILGRDCSGEIVGVGRNMHRYGVGEQVYCVRWIVGQGTHAEYVVVDKKEISRKPANITHAEAASFPYIACTTWSALINSCAVSTNSRKKQRIFIPAGSGGIGSFATQLCQALSHDIITSCSTDKTSRLEEIGIKNILNYDTETFFEDLAREGPFDVILDTLNEKYKKHFLKTLKTGPGVSYVSLRPSLLRKIDEQGLAMGTLGSGTDYLKSLACQLADGKGLYRWGMVSADAGILDRIRPYIEQGDIRPLIDRTFHIDDGIASYKYVQDGHACGKTVIDFQ